MQSCSSLDVSNYFWCSDRLEMLSLVTPRVSIDAADLVGAKRPTSAQDSHSLLSLLREEPDAHRPPVIHHSANGVFAIRDGRWKLVLGDGSGGREPPRGRPFARPYQLFDLVEDPAESQNRIADHPEVARRLEAQALSLIGPDR